MLFANNMENIPLRTKEHWTRNHHQDTERGRTMSFCVLFIKEIETMSSSRCSFTVFFPKGLKQYHGPDPFSIAVFFRSSKFSHLSRSILTPPLFPYLERLKQSYCLGLSPFSPFISSKIEIASSSRFIHSLTFSNNQDSFTMFCLTLSFSYLF